MAPSVSLSPAGHLVGTDHSLAVDPGQRVAGGRGLVHAAPVGGTDVGAGRVGEGLDGSAQPEPPGAPPVSEAAVAAAAGSDRRPT